MRLLCGDALSGTKGLLHGQAAHLSQPVGLVLMGAFPASMHISCSQADGTPKPVVTPGARCPGTQVCLPRSTAPGSELGAACVVMDLPTPASELRMGSPCQASVSLVGGLSAPASELRAARSTASVNGCSEPWDRILPDPDGAVAAACGPAPPTNVDSWVTIDGRAPA